MFFTLTKTTEGCIAEFLLDHSISFLYASYDLSYLLSKYSIMNNNIFTKFFALAILVTLIGIHTAIAGIFPDTTITSETITTYSQGRRLKIQAQVVDTEGVLEARCYFRSDKDAQFFYTPMRRQQGSLFTCTLPAFSKDTRRLEYFFLSVNNRKQAIRSQTFTALPARDNDAQMSPPVSAELSVYSELPQIDLNNTGITDSRVRFSFTPDSRLFGLRAGVYKKSTLPASMNSKQGYFGGFQLDPTGTARPVKGLAPNMSGRQLPTRSDITPQAGSDTPPDVAGADWAGYFMYGDSREKTDVTVEITLQGTLITITTSKTGIAHYFGGLINENGDIKVYDSYDDQTWTTHFGPATSTSINLYDYVRLPSPEEPDPPFNELIITRHFPDPPEIPTGVTASDGTYLDAIQITWGETDRTKEYRIYTCLDSNVETCSLLGISTDTLHLHRTQSHNPVYYRLKACNDYGCSNFSAGDTGYIRPIIIPLLYLLLN